MATLEKAISIAAIAHKGQKTKRGNPYVLHPLRLMMKMKSKKAMIVAVLHDVVEDTEKTLDDLRDEGFSEDILEAVDCVTKRQDGDKDEDYEPFIRRLESNSLAREVKIADLEDNMNIQRLTEIKSNDLERIEKYHKWWSYLTNYKK